MKIFALVLLTSTLSFGQNTNDRFNQIFSKLADANSPGIAVLVKQNGRTIYKYTAGVADLRTRAPITSATDFRLASCTKQFTAMAIMLLVHDRKLRYDQRLTDIFPEFPAYGRAITIRNVLDHTSGLPDYEDLMELASKQNPGNKGNNWSATHQITDAEVLKLLEQADHVKFAPGTLWAYSNSGYVLLGQVVAKVSGMSFPDFLRTRIFAPLKMTNTVAYVRGKNTVPNRAYGYSRDKSGAGFTDTDQSSTSATLGDGGVYSNLDDLSRWDDALAHHTLISEEEMKPALTPFLLPGQGKGAERLPKWSGDSGDSDPQAGKPVAYGFGWYLDPFTDSAGRKHPRMWHYGDTSGFESAIMRFTGTDKLSGVTIIILCNRTDVDPTKLVEKVAEVY